MEDAPLDPSVQVLLDSSSLKWIFVGGKGGVGKTTTSSSLSILLAQVRRSVLVISTDPAHNLSDAFDQKFSSQPVLVNGFTNLFAMEVDPTMPQPEGDLMEAGSASNFITELSSSIPGIDEAMSFGELLRSVQSMEYECIVFDTAPTGHTLRLLSFPQVLDKALSKLMQMRAQFSGVMAAMQGMLGGGAGGGEEEIFSKLDAMKTLIDNVNTQFQDPSLTTFVCVCIPEFLSLYETERLVQELTKQGIDTSVIVVNQLLFAPSKQRCEELAAAHAVSPEAVRAICDAQAASRMKMQRKYLDQMEDLYEDFHLVKIPLLEEEVRGVQNLRRIGGHLTVPYSPES